MAGEKYPDDILRRWESACEFSWDCASDKCGECLHPSESGDVILAFGDLDNAATRKFYLCASCGYQAMLSAHFPSATLIFVANEHRGVRLSLLPDGVRDRTIEAFEIVDRIHAHVAQIAGRPSARQLQDAPS